MKKSTLIALVSFFSISMFAVSSQAQVPCGGGIVGIGPFGIGVVIDCPPPVVVVRPRIVRPAPRVVVIERRGGCYEDAPCHQPRPVYRRPAYSRPAPAPAPRVAAAPVVAAPAGLATAPGQDFTRFSISLFVDSSSYEDGGLAGGGFNGRYMLSRQFAVEASISGLSSCTNCNEYASRVDSRFGIAGLWYLGGKRDMGMNLYLKGGVVFNSITFTNDLTGETSDVQQTNFELGGGLELKLSRAFGIYAEATGMVASEDDSSVGTGPIYGNMSNGIPSSDNGNGAFNFRAGISWHF